MTNDMAAPPPPPEMRELAVTRLCDHFAAGHIELDELERRLTATDAARSDVELVSLVRDLPALSEEPAPELAAEPPKDRGWALAVMGGATRKGRWNPPRQMNALAVMGGVELDFRHARFAPGEHHVIAAAVMGGIEIKVPAGLPVEVRGVGILGAVEQVDQETKPHHPRAPLLKITAVACMAGIEVRTYAPGEVDDD